MSLERALRLRGWIGESEVERGEDQPQPCPGTPQSGEVIHPLTSRPRCPKHGKGGSAGAWLDLIPRELTVELGVDRSLCTPNHCQAPRASAGGQGPLPVGCPEVRGRGGSCSGLLPTVQSLNLVVEMKGVLSPERAKRKNTSPIRLF